MNLQQLLGTELPIVQAPMAGVQLSALAIAASNAGSLGSLPCAMLTPEAMRKELDAIRAATRKPYNVNFFCHTPSAGSVDRESAWREINASLERLQTDRVDLIQLHAVGDLGELDLATAADGALSAATRALDEGLVGAVGITGHGWTAPATHLEALRRYPFATVLTPLNPVLWRDDAYRADYQALVDEVRRQDAGLMTIKTGSRRNWPEGAEKTHTTWYEPFDEQDRITAAVSWVLSHDEVTGIPTAGDVSLLRLFLEAERNRVSPADGEASLSSDTDYASPFVAMPF